MKKTKEVRGITLIALIITIIILLILAGITIAQLTGSGLFDKAKYASEESKYATAEEKVKLAVMASYGENGNLDNESLKTNINKIDGLEEQITTVTYDLTVKVDGYEFIINQYGSVTCVGRTENLPENTPDTEAGTIVALKDSWKVKTMRYVKTTNGEELQELEKVATVYAVSDGANNTVPVPYGFYYVGGTLDTGVVISDNEADKYDGKTDKTTHEYATKLKGNQFVWIPCSASNYKKISWGKENAKWDMETNSAENTQVEKYGGFYVGRYEAGVSTLNESTNTFEDSVTFNNSASLFNSVAIQTGINSWGWQNYDFTARQSGTIVATGSNKATGNIVEKANSIPYYHADYYTAVEMSRRLYSGNSYVSSGLVTGTQWDMMIKYIQDGGTDVTSTNWGNCDNVSLTNLRGYYTNVTTAGATDGFKTINGNLTSTNAGTGSYVLLTTGSTEQVMKRNLYDVAGNLWEWTQEASYIDNVDYNLNDTLNTYMLRGGSLIWTYASYPACRREFEFAPTTHTNFGFRVVLYMK